MPTQKESHAKRASISLTPRFHRRGTPPCPDQSPHNPKKRETNPIPPSKQPTAKSQKPLFTKQTQFLYRGCPGSQTTPHRAKQTQSTPGNYAKRTQFPPVSRLAFRISSLFRASSFGFRISPDLSGRIMRNKPNFRRGGLVEDQKMRNEPNLPGCENAKRTQSPPGKYTKRTQFRLAGNAKMRNEPNLPPCPPRLCETNPIIRTGTVPARRDAQNAQNEPNLHRGGPVEDQQMRNEPNLPRPHRPTDPIMRNEPNPTSPPVKKRETNPIPPSKQPTAKSQKPLFTKRTQFLYRGSLASQTTPHRAKHTQSTPGNYAKQTQS